MPAFETCVTCDRSGQINPLSPLSGLVDCLGTSKFEEKIVSVARSLLPHDHIGCHTFQIPSDRQTRFGLPLFIRSYDGGNAGSISGENYLSQWWREDPDIYALERTTLTSCFWTSSLLTSKVKSAGYVRDCANRSEVTERIAFTYRAETNFVSLRLYRRSHHRPLTQHELDGVARYGELLSSLCMKHSELMGSTRSSLFVKACSRAEARGTALSARERQTMERILNGRTISEIAVELGIAESSAITFRQRAYMKIGISKRTDLH